MFPDSFFLGGGNDPPAPSPTPIIGTVSYRPDWMYNYCYNNYYATVIGTTGLPCSLSRPWSRARVQCTAGRLTHAYSSSGSRVQVAKLDPSLTLISCSASGTRYVCYTISICSSTFLPSTIRWTYLMSIDFMTVFILMTTDEYPKTVWCLRSSEDLSPTVPADY